jgi:hypothetical protein
MASLGSSTRLGNANTSSLIRSARSLQNQIQAYQDDVQSLTYANSAYTDDAFSSYSNYLGSRINQLNSTGSIADATKAISMVKTLESATHANISASITRENIQIMAGGANLKDKYNLIVNQFQRAMGIGDLTLAQTLEKQAYDVDQQIQYQAQQATDAAATLAKAGNGRTSGTSGVSYQGEVVSNLKTGLSYINGLAKSASEKEMNSTLKEYVKENAPALNALGVHIDNNQPNYWDVVYGVSGAIYNAQVLKAQAEAPNNPLVAKTYATEAANYLNGQTKIQTLAGSLTVQEIQQAQQDPAMFAFDNSTGAYKRTIQTGYQYMNMTNGDGTTSQQLVPTYSGMTQRNQFNKVFFLSPTQTTQMTKLGLNFGENKSGTTGDGVQVQLSENSPQWLKGLLGENGVTNMYTDQNGFLVFKGASSTGAGNSSFTLTSDDKGLHGLYEHLGDGSTKLVGGDYGYNSQAVQLLLNRGQQVQQQVRVAQAKAQEQLQIQQQQAAQQLHMQQQAQQAAALKVQKAPTAAPATTNTARLQPAASLQSTLNPQKTVSPLPATYNPQQTVNGFNLNQSGSGGIKLGHL